MNNSVNRVALVSLVLSGCMVDDPDDPAVSDTTQNSEINNGVSLNGISMNGISMNGISMNGISMNGISMNGISMNGTSLAATVGSTWSASLSNGGAATLRIDTAIQGAGANSDVGMYGVSIQSDGGWQPLCGVDAAGAPILALAVPGTWNLSNASYAPSTTVQTFACRAKTVAKCVEMGYKPWTGHASQLASCTRMLRGDYCGTGVPYTVDGQHLNVYDSVGIQVDTEAWLREAEWTPNGARCIAKKSETRFYETGNDPLCYGDTLKSKSDCALGFGAGAVLISEIPGVN